MAREHERRPLYSQLTLFGHPIHPMLIAYPIALYTATLVAFIIAAARGDTFWFRVAVVASKHEKESFRSKPGTTSKPGQFRRHSRGWS